jgi:hypothetical protein
VLCAEEAAGLAGWHPGIEAGPKRASLCLHCTPSSCPFVLPNPMFCSSHLPALYLLAHFPYLPACLLPSICLPLHPACRPAASGAPGRAVHLGEAQRHSVQLRHRGHPGRVHPAGGNSLLGCSHDLWAVRPRAAVCAVCAVVCAVCLRVPFALRVPVWLPPPRPGPRPGARRAGPR